MIDGRSSETGGKKSVFPTRFTTYNFAWVCVNKGLSIALGGR